MPACIACGGFGKVMVQHPQTRKMTQTDCVCQKTKTPGRIPHPNPQYYPPEVMQALRQASHLQRTAIQMRDDTDV